MQVARFWRMKKQAYRLEGVVYENGTTSMTGRAVRDEPKNHTDFVAAVDTNRTKNTVAA